MGKFFIITEIYQTAKQISNELIEKLGHVKSKFYYIS